MSEKRGLFVFPFFNIDFSFYLLTSINFSLVKDKEQYKQDIVNLKAKLSTCGQDTSAKDAEASNYNSVKLVKQLEQTENRLITVQEALDEVQYERDMYKSKVRIIYHIGFSLSHHLDSSIEPNK